MNRNHRLPVRPGNDGLWGTTAVVTRLSEFNHLWLKALGRNRQMTSWIQAAELSFLRGVGSVLQLLHVRWFNI